MLCLKRPATCEVLNSQVPFGDRNLLTIIPNPELLRQIEENSMAMVGLLVEKAKTLMGSFILFEYKDRLD
jgi:hypothetical protein